MLADLELRLGLPGLEHADPEREVAMLDRARRHLVEDPTAFFSRSFAVDPAGTAGRLLAMRDELVEGGWNPRGDVTDAFGPRIATLRAIEALAPLPPGRADRLTSVLGELERTGHPVADHVGLLEPMTVWPGAWRRVFERMRRGGSRVDFTTPELKGAPPGTDLHGAQLALRRKGKEKPAAQQKLSGDGTLIDARAPTSWELGEATAALLRVLVPTDRARKILVVRVGDTAPLDAALVAQGLRSQGLTTSSSLRPAQQLLPLALSMLFLPRDVFRALELLSLPLSPIPWRARRAMLGALGEAAGIGGRRWVEALDGLEPGDRARVATWIEPPGVPRGEGAPRDLLLEVVDRLRIWAAGRRASVTARGAEEGDLDAPRVFDGLLGATAAVRAALLADGRARFAPHELDVLLASCAVTSRAAQSFEEPNRPDHLDGPSGVLASRPVVVLWNAGKDVATAPPELFRVAERRALADAGAFLPDAAHVLEARAAAWRRAVLAATECLIVASPEAHLGQPQPVLPVWDEIVARLDLAEETIASITVTAQQLREGEGAWATAGELVGTPVEQIPLPEHEAPWQLDRAAADAAVSATIRLSASGVEMLLGCPLRFVLERAASLYPARVTTVSDGVLLKGTLGHRLVEELHRAELLEDPAKLRDQAPAILERLLGEEAGPLLRLGRGSERQQIQAQLLKAAQKLSELLVESQLRVEAVELKVEDPSDDGVLHGRVDMLLRDPRGEPFVLDLKLGRSSYAEKLEAGLAVQLAHYGHVVRRTRKLAAFPPVAYFSLGAGRAFAIEGTPLAASGTDFLQGPPVAATADALVRSTSATRRLIASGVVPVTGVGDEPTSLAATLGDDPGHLQLPAEAGCGFCDKGPICGRAWGGRS
jgi:ATP-dependent helicase/nuclease subunit B